MDVARQHPLAQQGLILPGTVAGVGPHIRSGVAGIEQIGQAGPGMRRGIADQPAADQPVPAIGVDVVLVAELGDRQIDQRRRARARLGLGRLDGPAGIAVLLGELGRLVLPALRHPAVLDRLLLGLVLRCLGAATMVASTSCPDMAR